MKPIKDKILESIQPVIANSVHVSLDQTQLQRVAQELKDVKLPVWDNELQLKATIEQTVQYYFFLDSINFCFWAPKGKEKWHFQKNGEWLSGYYAYSYAIKKAFEANNRFYDADYLANIPFDEFASIFTGRGELLLLKERWEIIRENFQILTKQFDGQAMNIVRQASGDVNVFIESLLEHFPSFRDQVELDGHTVYLLKRAQILPSDISFAETDKQLFANLDDLSIFADYKLPQILQAEGVLEYSAELLHKIKDEQLIEKNSQEEIEIRVWTVQACYLLRQELERIGRTVNDQELDWILWVLAKQRTFVLPHHKTVTTFY